MHPPLIINGILMCERKEEVNVSSIAYCYDVSFKVFYNLITNYDGMLMKTADLTSV